MIDVVKLFNFFKKKNITFFTGVPDSVLKNMDFFFNKKNKNSHIITTNEGSAVSLGIGYYLAKKKIPGIYLQNSGLSNALNPLLSIANSRVYSIPLLLIIGWRGSPSEKDEPQHKIKGKITQRLLSLSGIKNIVLNNEKDFKKLSKLINYAKIKKVPVACLIKKNVLKSKSIKKFTKDTHRSNISRKYFISRLLDFIDRGSKVISTTGYISREVHEVSKRLKKNPNQFFYMVGGMGHSSMVSLGYSLNSKKKVICLDGDGSLLMHLGSAFTIASFANKNFKHILLNNNSHESVGGQPTYIQNMNIKLFVKSLGYKNYFFLKDKKKFNIKIKKFFAASGPSFLEVNINKKSSSNLTRPNNFKKIKNNFMRT